MAKSRSRRSPLQTQAIAIWFAAIAVACTLLPSVAARGLGGSAGEARRGLLGFAERRGNTSFLCSPSGPCIRCQYPEKNDYRYRCSETGYRIPLKCEVQNTSTAQSENPQRKLSALRDESKIHFVESRMSLHRSIHVLGLFKWRNLLDASMISEDGEQSYITYRSCLPMDPEEKLSVFGFEVIMVCLLLVSAPFAYFRQRRSGPFPSIGLVRLPNSSSRL